MPHQARKKLFINSQQDTMPSSYALQAYSHVAHHQHVALMFTQCQLLLSRTFDQNIAKRHFFKTWSNTFVTRNHQQISKWCPDFPGGLWQWVWAKSLEEVSKWKRSHLLSPLSCSPPPIHVFICLQPTTVGVPASPSSDSHLLLLRNSQLPQLTCSYNQVCLLLAYENG